ncbi:MAG: NADH-quinone oxidoreductase subunit NuoH [SAR202 cluster bacterium]|nr:NADH-quinone oxidoreductase subunit NuoH [Chloroflexota bacterium]MQG51226.1 NADH-quinone oxidoreductase subunit NuoH [SAR202 cluster bacterium]|tara:strand:+ start:290 stop:1423 length:1134 start_codon:yes stop_codon:yes gene_type:complete
MSIVDLFLLQIKIIALFGGLTIVVLSMVWLERRVLGKIQRRIGPNRVGPQGLLQSLADGIKLLVKEDIIPESADKWIYWLAPIIVFVPPFVIWVTIPIASDNSVLAVNNMNLGLLFVIALTVVSITGLVMAGWGSANKYAILGGLRSTAQLISYEIPIIMVAISVLIICQTTDLKEIVDKQNIIPYAIYLPLGLLLFFIAGIAEVGRIPFDIYHAESEIVGGPFVEYSGAHWSVFYLAEYIQTFTIAVLITLLFLGGWHIPFVSLQENIVLGFFITIIKSYGVVLIIFWFRGTFPRMRIDQLMSFAWKVLIPLSFANVIFSSVIIFYDIPLLVLSIINILMTVIIGYVLYTRFTSPAKIDAEEMLRKARNYKLPEGI